MEQSSYNVMDLLQVFSLVIGYMNLIENREQSADNDVNKANDKQANYLLTNLQQSFDNQNKMLEEILDRLQKLEDRK